MRLWPVLLQQAKRRRKNPTPAEAALWHASRNRKLGVKFRREHAIRQWVADFCSVETMLVVEVDGPVHDTMAQQDTDRIKDDYLTRLGFRVLRFSNHRVLSEMDAVLGEIRGAFLNHRSRQNH